jgi:hypothetical protein
VSDYDIAIAIKSAGSAIARAMVEQKPKLVVVPLIVNLSNRELTDEEAHRMASALKGAFEEALK